jgi:hypothetical protein
MEIEKSDLHNENVPLQIDERRDWDPNVTKVKVSHSVKHWSEMISTEEGMKTEDNRRHPANASILIDVRREPDSKATLWRE